MKMSLQSTVLTTYVSRQINIFFPDQEINDKDLHIYIDKALERIEYCFSHIGLKYFFDGQQARFNHLHTDQYAMFLYFLSNTIYHLGGNPSLSSKIYALNKALHAVDAFYEVELPDIFAFQHPVGTVIGRGKYSNYFFVYQRCSIGANLDDVYPVIGEGVVMFGGSAIIGNCVVGNNCWLSVGTVVMNQNIASNSYVFGHSPHTIVKKAKKNVVIDMFIRSGNKPNCAMMKDETD